MRGIETPPCCYGRGQKALPSRPSCAFLGYVITLLSKPLLGASMHNGPNILWRYSKDGGSADSITGAPLLGLHANHITDGIAPHDHDLPDEVNLMQTWVVESHPNNSAQWPVHPVTSPTGNATATALEKASPNVSNTFVQQNGSALPKYSGAWTKADVVSQDALQAFGTPQHDPGLIPLASRSAVVSADASVSMWDGFHGQAVWKELESPISEAATVQAVNLQLLNMQHNRTIFAVSAGVMLALCTSLVLLMWIFSRHKEVDSNIIKPPMLAGDINTNSPSESTAAHSTCAEGGGQTTDITGSEPSPDSDESQVRPNFTGCWVLTRVEGDMDTLLKESGECLIHRMAQRMRKYGVGQQAYHIVQEGNAFQMTMQGGSWLGEEEVVRFLSEGGEQHVGTSRSTIVDPRWTGQTLVITQRHKTHTGEASEKMAWTFKGEFIELDVISPTGIHVKRVFLRS